MKKSLRYLAVPTLALGAVAMAGSPAMAADSSYQGALNALNGSSATGQVMVELNGNEATVTLDVSGLPETFNDAAYPHVQHIHIAGQGVCPTPDADANGDGIVDTVEGGPSYGEIGTTLSTSGATDASTATDLKAAGQGGAYTYERTFEMNQATIDSLKAGTSVVVVHGLDPATLSEEAANAKSNLVPELPLAATSPAACGVLTASQMGAMPEGGADTGVAMESTSDSNALGMIALGGGLVLAAAAGGTYVVRRRGDNA